MTRPRIRLTTDLKRHVAGYGCILSGHPEAQLCHLRPGHEGGTGLKPDDDLVLPLAISLHDELDARSRGPDGLSGHEWLTKNVVHKLARDVWVIGAGKAYEDEQNIIHYLNALKDNS